MSADDTAGRRALPRGTVPAAVGAFLLTLAAMLPLYVYDRVAVLPAQGRFEMTMVADGAGYLDTSRWAWVDGVRIVRNTSVSAQAHGPDWSAWEMSVDTVAEGAMIDHWSRRAIVDRDTGRAVNCCGEHVNGDRAVRQAGLVFSWPPGVGEADHPFYDAEVRAAPVMEFQGTDEVAGLTVRRYTQEIPATQVPESAREVPAWLFTPGAEGTVTAGRWLELTRTYWVEPVSGTVVNAHEARLETLRPQNASGEAHLLYAELGLRENQIAGRAEQARVRSLLLRSLDSWAPWALGPAGGLLLVAGGAIALRDRSRDAGRDGRGGAEGAGAPADSDVTDGKRVPSA
ncbi:DUF3068 domain-containing protein [Nocardiopsis changdeensis]|uniref:DUF3068 domain-containing protein n=1 Tax=Nocardiopsis changdeensis TaxID=2831969 RepID=A0ABX8BNR8_9ACTN|nr:MULTISPECIES: DUF3068 domain-containing protein [Nocardiopsis]QUX23884.1 DUF3068 domain-containing protein [Nocardiopsis changdeensis]QYX39830.1 DUF3068 domain-containing protein [Nocardiopsis sp. MT53]